MRELLIGVGGVLLGWLLSQLSLSAADIRRVRVGSRVLVAELASNRGKLRLLREQGVWGGSGGPDRSAWRAHRADVFWLADADCRGALIRAYQELDQVAALVKGDNGSPLRLAEIAAGPQGTVLDDAIGFLDVAMIRLLPMCNYGLRRYLWRLRPGGEPNA